MWNRDKANDLNSSVLSQKFAGAREDSPSKSSCISSTWTRASKIYFKKVNMALQIGISFFYSWIALNWLRHLWSSKTDCLREYVEKFAANPPAVFPSLLPFLSAPREGNWKEPPTLGNGWLKTPLHKTLIRQGMKRRKKNSSWSNRRKWQRTPLVAAKLAIKRSGFPFKNSLMWHGGAVQTTAYGVQSNDKQEEDEICIDITEGNVGCTQLFRAIISTERAGGECN